MIRKLQIKFVAMCMVLVTAVLGVVFAAVLVSAKQNIEVISHQVLERVIQDDAPNSRPALGPNQNGEEVLLPYFTVNLWDSNGVYQAFVTSGTYANLQDTAELEDILSDCLRQGQPEGTIGSYGLRYMRQDYGLYQRIAFVDMSMEQATLQELMGSYLQIGLAALILLLGVSILLARWATRPVARAWRQQRQFLSDASHELKTLAFEPVAFEAGKPLESDIAPDVTVTGDGDKLRQLIGVLLDNAIKYGQAGGTITLSLRRTDRQARLTVSNPGEPIPPEQLSRLFERFYRADASRGEQSGFGLGLPIAAAIASEHKGTLKAESDQVSTRFLFTMPLKK